MSAILRSTLHDALALLSSPLTAEPRARIRRDLVELSLQLFADDVDLTGRGASSVRITCSCLELAETMGPMPSAVDLGAALGISDRWLRAAFRNVYGMSPSAFFRSQALDGARRDLLAGDPSSTSVTGIATRWGFWHLGRFSGAYRSFFGELPSATLAQAG